MGMRCVECGSTAVAEQPERTAQGYKRFRCRAYDELGNYLRPRTRHNQHVPAFRRRLPFLQRIVTVLGLLEAV
jgi:putative transposase